MIEHAKKQGEIKLSEVLSYIVNIELPEIDIDY